jgi:biopolymer transport protein ExbB/TolQ
MGTLIPLGPALVGLAEGDLATLANNMIIAFSTTVVGVLISLIALAINSAKKSWYREDSILVNFTAERLSANNNTKNND